MLNVDLCPCGLRNVEQSLEGERRPGERVLLCLMVNSDLLTATLDTECGFWPMNSYYLPISIHTNYELALWVIQPCHRVMQVASHSRFNYQQARELTYLETFNTCH